MSRRRRSQKDESAGVEEDEIPVQKEEPMAPSPPKGTLKVALLSPRAAALQAPMSASGRRSLKEKVLQLNNESEQLQQAGKMDEADARLRQAHNLVVSADEDDITKVDLLAITLNNIGCLEKKRGDLDEALKHLESCARLEDKVIHVEKKAITRINLASTYLANNEFSSASRAAKAALEILFAKYAGGVDATKHARKELLQFSAAWMLQAKADMALFSTGSGKSDRRTAEAHQVLNEFRNAAHASKELLGKDDPSTKAAAEEYKRAKEELSHHVAVAIKSLNGDAEPAFPGDEVNVMSPRGVQKRPDSSVSINRAPSASRLRKQGSFASDQLSPSTSFGNARGRSVEATPKVKPLETPRTRSLSTDSKNDPWSPKMAGSPSGGPGSRMGSAKRRTSRLDPLDSPGGSIPRVDSFASPMSIDLDSHRRQSRLPTIENSGSFVRKLATSNSSATDAGSPLSRKSSTVAKPLPILHVSRERMGLQLLFGVAEETKVKYVVLRFIYMYLRENIAMFPCFRLTGASTLTSTTAGAEKRLEAMEQELQNSNCDSAAQRIREQREKIRRQKEAELKTRDLNAIVLDPSMTRRVNGRIQRQRLLLQSAKVLLMNVEKSHLMLRFKGWMQHAKERKKYRPLRRVCAQILRKMDSGILRMRFLKWVKFVKICRQRVSAGLKPRDFEARRQAIAMQELAELGRMEAKRLEEQRQEQIRRQMEEDRLAEEEERRIAEANRVPTPPPKISEIIAEEIQAVYDAWYLAETSKGTRAAAEQLDAVKVSFKNTLTSFVTSDIGLNDLERIEALSEDERAAEVDALTNTVSPFIISLISGAKYHSKANEDLVHCMLCTTHELVDYHRILFDDELFMSVIAEGSIKYFSMLLTTIPKFEVENEYLIELLTLCVKSENYALDFVELCLQHDKICKFKPVKSQLAKLWLHFLDRCIPSTGRGPAMSNPRAKTVNNKEYRQRITTILERLSLDQDTFDLPHAQELADKQTLLSRLCANGDLELVEIYSSLLDEAVCHNLLTRKQSDETTCLVNAVKSQNVELVSYLLSTHSCCGEKINQKVDGFSTVLDIAKVKGNIPGMISILRQYGAKDDEEESSTRPGSVVPMSLEGSARRDDDHDHHDVDLGSISSHSSGYHMLDDALEF